MERSFNKKSKIVYNLRKESFTSIESWENLSEDISSETEEFSDELFVETEDSDSKVDHTIPMDDEEHETENPHQLEENGETNNAKTSVMELENKKQSLYQPASAAGYDIFCVKGFEIKPNEHKVIFTDLALEMPNNCYARIAPKSSLSLNNIIINAGVIDCDYRGNIRVLMYNFGSEIIIFEPGSAIAEIIFEQIMHPTFIEKTDSLDITDRNEKGFGECSKIAFSQNKEFGDCDNILLSEKEEENFDCDEITLSQKVDCNEITLSEKEDFGD
ncbi:deoxyuridine 5'-triphosphate nucleotidohydrolase-like [Centruroides sculpturatus]|uniref:deoxyuridine 5'-triphosphate nucleotidohydrolase-like n=1 Tax=Centruroides sculpturatus TaxID=218467 RepID=UPI000C6D93D3|nr:deoxyuridine 5'-triphosphate nucleotidohydrolase-like [Centruroides sculpturatus]